jgi:hypothetical protein
LRDAGDTSGVTPFRLVYRNASAAFPVYRNASTGVLSTGTPKRRSLDE